MANYDTTAPTAAPTTTPDPVIRTRRRPQDYLGLVMRGFFMGSADLVPGVSGGTIALLLGIYRELIESIRSVARPPFWRALTRLQIREALAAVNAPFLLAVLAGIALAIVLLSRGLEHLLSHYPEFLWSFFFGLVVATILSIGGRIRRWRAATFVALALGTAGAYILVGLLPAQTPETAWFIFLAGAITICAMILPGISGAFILVFLGKYQYMVSAINNRDIATIALFIGGAAVGIVTFAQILGWLFRTYRNLTLAVLVGIMIGSLRKLWPWKSGGLPVVDEFGVTLPAVERNVLPPFFVGGEFNVGVILALALALLGALAVLGLERLAGPDDPDMI